MRVAAANVAPAWGDPEATTGVALRWMQEAARQGCELVAFGECFLSGYPVWVDRTDGAVFDDARQKDAFRFYLERAVTLDGPEVAQLVEAARDLGVFVYLGVTERGTRTATGTVYATLLAIDPARGLVGAHRKLRPTYEERLVWGPGDGHGLRAHDVHAGDGAGWRVSGLNCWENWMPQARHAMWADGSQLHVSAWPGQPSNTRDAVRFAAMEGRVYAVGAGAMLTLDDITPDFPLLGVLREVADEAPVAYRGGSCIADPRGDWLVEPMTEEGLAIADLDQRMVLRERQTFDPTGHYSRPDVFSVTIDRRRREAATFLDDA